MLRIKCDRCSTNRVKVKELLKSRGLRPIKRLGQNFLIDETILMREVELAGVENKKVLEVGPGPGTLTRFLAMSAEHVLAIEKDIRFRPFLEEVLKDYHNVEVEFADVLDYELPKRVVVSNLPYSISSPFTLKLIESGNEGVICYQKEFAERLLAEPGTKGYGRLSAKIKFLANVEALMEVPSRAFWPEPRTDSMLVRITPKEKPAEWDKLNTVINEFFKYPAKTLKKVSKITRIKVPKELETRRVRELSPELLLLLVNYLN